MSPCLRVHSSSPRLAADLARYLPDPVQAQQAAEMLAEPLAHSPDPDMALANLSRWAAQLANRSSTFATLREDPRLLEDLLRVFASSQYLADILIREPTAYTLLLEPDEVWQREDLRARMAAVAAPFTRPDSRLEALRRARRRELLRIGWRDLSGRAPFGVVVAKISELADALIEQTLATVRAPLAERQPDLDRQVRFVVIAMGKLGGSELNYSSDIDLLFLYDSPTLHDAHLRYATRLAEALFTALSVTTAEGALFRVDMRLRPEGRLGALVRSLASYREYYDRWIETWERQALIKARPVAGDAELGGAFAALAVERAYPSLHPATLFEDVRDVRAAIERRVEQRDETDINVKEGRGTIREIEFTVQLLQLLFGACRPEIRTGNTLEALAALTRADLLSAEEQAGFEDHYIFFRTVEHRLQLLHNLPVRLVPRDPEEQRKLGLRMGLPADAADHFGELYRSRAGEVQALSHAILDRLTPGGVLAADPLRLMILALAPQSGVGALGRSGDQETSVARISYPAKSKAVPPTPASEYAIRNTPQRSNADLIRRLAATGLRDPASAVERLQSLATGAPRYTLPLSTTRLFADFASPLLEAVSAAPDPDGALAAVAEVARRLGTHRTLYQTLQTEPDMLRALCQVVGFSPAVQEMVLRSPELLDVLYDQPLRVTPRPLAALRDDMHTRLERAFSPADRLTALRRFRNRELVRIIARDLLVNVDGETILGELSDLADACLMGALEVTGDAQGMRGAGPTPGPAGFAIIALGRLGGHELHYRSDLDLLYVYEPPPGEARSHRDYEALAAALTQGLQDWQREGQLYPVDLRLRPEGKSGYMVVHLDAARRYYLGGRAQSWERQALIRARPVAGDAGVAARFMEVATDFVYGRSLSSDEETELRAMKHRIESERVSAEERVRHLKLGPGGLSDIEFLVQRLQLLHGADQPSLRSPGTLAPLAAAVRLGLLPQDAGLDAAFTFLTRLRQHLRLRATASPADRLPDDADELGILARSFGLPDAAALMDQYHATTAHVRALFVRHFLGG